MAKSKPPRRKHRHLFYGRTKNPAKPKWMRITKLITIIIFSILLILATIAVVMKYYKLVATHK